MKGKRIAFYISTGLLTLLMGFSVTMYLTNPNIGKVFESLGHPSYIPYPLATLKVLGIITIWTGFSARLKEWAYAGFFFNFVLATAAHHFAGHGIVGYSSLAIILLLTSYFTYPEKDE